MVQPLHCDLATSLPVRVLEDRMPYGGSTVEGLLDVSFVLKWDCYEFKIRPASALGGGCRAGPIGFQTDFGGRLGHSEPYPKPDDFRPETGRILIS